MWYHLRRKSNYILNIADAITFICERNWYNIKVDQMTELNQAVSNVSQFSLGETVHFGSKMHILGKSANLGQERRILAEPANLD